MCSVVQVTATCYRTGVGLGEPHYCEDGFGQLLEFAWTGFGVLEDTRLCVFDDTTMGVRRTVKIRVQPPFDGMNIFTVCVDRRHGRLFAILEDDPRLEVWSVQTGLRRIGADGS